jgi:predicted GIY-YIG superfamily endonuclease
MKKNYVIYALYHPVTKELAYVGKTANIKARIAGHVQGIGSKSLEWAIWANQITDLRRVDYEILEDELSQKQAHRREIYWIRRKWREGAALLNQNRNPGMSEYIERIHSTKWWAIFESSIRR